jgi:hypothetical protein
MAATISSATSFQQSWQTDLKKNWHESTSPTKYRRANEISLAFPCEDGLVLAKARIWFGVSLVEGFWI